MTSATCRFQKTQKIRKIYEGPREISERVKILLVFEFTRVSEITPVDGNSGHVGNSGQRITNVGMGMGRNTTVLIT